TDPTPARHMRLSSAGLGWPRSSISGLAVAAGVSHGRGQEPGTLLPPLGIEAAALAPGKAETATGRSITASLLFCEPGFGALIIGSSGSSHSVTAALKR